MRTANTAFANPASQRSLEMRFIVVRQPIGKPRVYLALNRRPSPAPLFVETVNERRAARFATHKDAIEATYLIPGDPNRWHVVRVS